VARKLSNGIAGEAVFMAVQVILSVIISSVLKVLNPAKNPFLLNIFAQVVANKCYRDQAKQGPF
jgi:hypothetical protein